VVALRARLRPSLVGLSLAPAPCYSARGAGAGGARKCGFFGLLDHFVRREKNSSLLQYLVQEEPEPLEALPNRL
jgi:hypothetical protein